MIKNNLLTPRQAQVFQFIGKRIKDTGYAPTVREIGEEFGINSPNGVVANLRALVKKGVIVREPGMSRGIRLVRGRGVPGKCPLCGGRRSNG